MSIEGVAESAGVAKTTIYRRWSSKEELISASIATLYGDSEMPDTGSVRDDLVQLVGRVRSFMASQAGQIMPRMLGELAAGSALGRAYLETVVRPRRQLLVAVTQRGIERGQLREDLDVELLVNSIIGTMMFMRLATTRFFEDDGIPDDVIDHLLEGKLTA